VTAENAPEHIRGYGSPTILVDGRDVEGLPPGDAPSCRYGVPRFETILAALRNGR
jgi:hypothetical protein